jgi:hypothetical protein
MKTNAHLETITRYLRAIESGGFAEIAKLFAPDGVGEQFPNRIYQNGIK